MNKIVAGLAGTLIFSCVTPAFSQEKEVNFDREYIKANYQPTTIEINEAQELIPNPVKVFDEYLTWGLFILYAYDHYNNKELRDEVVKNVNEMMIKKGFPEEAAFNEELLRLYEQHKPEKIAGLYVPLLAWSATQ